MFVIDEDDDGASRVREFEPVAISRADFESVQLAREVLRVLWFIEESYDNVLNNALDLQTAVARIEAGRRANVSPMPDETDSGVRLLNRLLLNFLSSARLLYDGSQHAISQGPFDAKLAAFNKLFSVQFDKSFSYRLLDALRNHAQHHAHALSDTLTITRRHQLADGESLNLLRVEARVGTKDLLADKSLRPATRKEIEALDDPAIDLMPHIAAYLRGIGTAVDQSRVLFEPEMRSMDEIYNRVVKPRLADEWDVLYAIAESETNKANTVLLGAHKCDAFVRPAFATMSVTPPPFRTGPSLRARDQAALISLRLGD